MKSNGHTALLSVVRHDYTDERSFVFPLSNRWLASKPVHSEVIAQTCHFNNNLPSVGYSFDWHMRPIFPYSPRWRRRPLKLGFKKKKKKNSICFWHYMHAWSAPSTQPTITITTPIVAYCLCNNSLLASLWWITDGLRSRTRVCLPSCSL